MKLDEQTTNDDNIRGLLLPLKNEPENPTEPPSDSNPPPKNSTEPPSDSNPPPENSAEPPSDSNPPPENSTGLPSDSNPPPPENTSKPQSNSNPPPPENTSEPQSDSNPPADTTEPLSETLTDPPAPSKSSCTSSRPGTMRIQGTGEKNDPIYLDEEYETDNLEEEFSKSDLDMGAHQGDRDLDFSYGTAFEKLEYESYIDKPNPWHADLRKPLFPAQVIGFRWMFERHGKGGGVVADKVGIGKVSISASVPAALLS